jgi:hypothetical protein
MTKTQQKLARQAMTFLDYGGKALNALLSMLLLAAAVVFEGIGGAALVLATLIEHDVCGAEFGQKSSRARAIRLTAMPSEKRNRLQGTYSRNPASALTATAGGKRQ